MQTLYHELMHSLEILNQEYGLTYLIKLLNGTKISNDDYEKIGILIFLLARSQPLIMSDPQAKPLQKLCQKCFCRMNSDKLLELLNKPQNNKINPLFGQFILETVNNVTQVKPRIKK